MDQEQTCLNKDFNKFVSQTFQQICSDALIRDFCTLSSMKFVQC